MLLLNEELKQEAVNEANFNTSYVVIKLLKKLRKELSWWDFNTSYVVIKQYCLT